MKITVKKNLDTKSKTFSRSKDNKIDTLSPRDQNNRTTISS